MAKGGGRRRGGWKNQPRDARGRFASTGSTSSGGKKAASKGKTSTAPKAAASTSKAKPKQKPKAAPQASNAIAPSPRQLTREERIYAEVMSTPKLRSDRQRLAEMQRRGLDLSKADPFALRESVLAKIGRPGSKTTDPAAALKAERAAMRKRSGGGDAPKRRRSG